MKVLLLSTYELGHQPLGLARPAAHLQAAGHDVACTDLAVEHLDERAVREADLVGISIPMHTATRLGARLSERVHALNPSAHRCFYGLYASLNAEALLGRCADSVIGGEYETPLVELADRLGPSPRPLPQMERGELPGVITLDGGEVFLGRQSFAVPRRELLPPLERYSRLNDGETLRLAGYVEASRGCAHRCLHCPITPVYGGRLRIVEPDVVLGDIRQLVQMGAEHVTFGDPDFFNGIKHSLRIVEALQKEFPGLTYDATIKIEHLLEHRRLLPTLKETGCLFVISAVEAIDDTILANLRKGHTVADVETALDLTAAAGLTLRPTFVPFTPWTTRQAYLRLLEFIEQHDLIGHVDPVQLSVRLLVPHGSSLIGTPAMQPFLGPFDDTTFSHTWKHPDSTLDVLQREVAGIVEEATRSEEDGWTTFYRVKQAALSTLTGHAGADPPKLATKPSHVPRLTEAWFC
jgi:radical SAM superfamily enzyme YgiQ (UPF0313 family)